MIIKYHWEQVKVNYPKGYMYRTQITNVDWDYQVDIKVNDIVDYLIPNSLRAKDLTKEQVVEKGYSQFYMEKALRYLVEECNMDLEQLESDPYFVEYMHDKYEDDAFQDFQDNNESDY